MNLKKIKKDFDKLSSSEQWEWLVKTDLKEEFTLFLDNDDAFITFNCDEDGKFVLSFKDFISNAEGAYFLLEAIGVNVEGV